jgi:hypothetical protein
MAFQDVGDRLDDGRIGQHPDFGSVDPDVGQQRLELLGHKAGRNVVDTGHPGRRLGHQRGHDRHAVPAQGGERLEIGLDTGAPARIGAGDGQQVGDQGRQRCVPCMTPSP